MDDRALIRNRRCRHPYGASPARRSSHSAAPAVAIFLVWHRGDVASAVGRDPGHELDWAGDDRRGTVWNLRNTGTVGRGLSGAEVVAGRDARQAGTAVTNTVPGGSAVGVCGGVRDARLQGLLAGSAAAGGSPSTAASNIAIKRLCGGRARAGGPAGRRGGARAVQGGASPWSVRRGPPSSAPWSLRSDRAARALGVVAARAATGLRRWSPARRAGLGTAHVRLPPAGAGAARNGAAADRGGRARQPSLLYAGVTGQHHGTAGGPGTPPWAGTRFG